MKYSMRSIWRAREMILYGYSVKEVARELKMSESVVRKYTISERKKVKDSKSKSLTV